MITKQLQVHLMSSIVRRIPFRISLPPRDPYYLMMSRKRQEYETLPAVGGGDDHSSEDISFSITDQDSYRGVFDYCVFHAQDGITRHLLHPPRSAGLTQAATAICRNAATDHQHHPQMI